MKFLVIRNGLLWFNIIAFSLNCLFAQEGELKVPKVEALFASSVPEVTERVDFEKLPRLAVVVSTASEDAADYTQAGFSYLHAGWDFEAYRHFCQALREDENCLMAHAGLALSLSSPYQHEFISQRNAAILRILELVESVRPTEEEEYRFPSIERGFAIAVSHLFVDGRAMAVQAFGHLAKKYKKDKQIPILYAIFHRDGYDALDKPNFGEAKALAMIEGIYKENPENIVAAQYFLALRIDAPLSPETLSNVALPVARKYAATTQLATAQHWLGMFEYRCGNLKEAEVAFRKSVSLLKEWKDSNGISNEDAGALWRSQLFLATVLAELGKLDEAEQIAEMFLNLKVDEKRVFATGAQLVLWDGWTLKTRLNMSLDNRRVSKAMAALATAKVLDPFKGKSAAIFFHQALHCYLATKKAHLAGDESARETLKRKFFQSVVNFDALKDSGLRGSEVYSYLRAIKWLRQLTSELRAEVESFEAVKTIELEDAISESSLPKRMLPPMHVYEFEEELIPFLIKRKEYSRAESVLRKALKRRPSLKSLWVLAEKLGKVSGNKRLAVEADFHLETLK